MGVRVLCAAVACALLAAVGATAGRGDSTPRVTLIGDSVATGMLWHNDAIAIMQNNLYIDWQVAVCRRLTTPSCPFQGQQVPNLLQLVQTLGTVAPVVVVEMGYNDPPATFPQAIDQSMHALLAAGAKHVLWLTLRAVEHPFLTMNAQLAAATKRWPQLKLVDWNLYSRSHPDWFQSDGMHLVDAGGVGMATLVHLAVDEIVNPLTIVSRSLPPARVGAPYSARLVGSGGTPPYRWSMVGWPPHGLHLLAGGRVVGVPRRVWSGRLRLRVQDAEGQQAVRLEQLAVAS